MLNTATIQGRLCADPELRSTQNGNPMAHIAAYFPIPKSASNRERENMEDGSVRHAKRPDADNIAKIVLDSLNDISYHDDSQIVTLIVEKLYSEFPRVVVTLLDELEE